LDQAHPALTNFILMSHAAGRRLVLVITGKGLATGKGQLRRQVPLWLGLAPLAPLILQTTAAHISHGGDGALYVYLRRSR
jgi:DNA-nicking Smr family endonuclease